MVIKLRSKAGKNKSVRQKQENNKDRRMDMKKKGTFGKVMGAILSLGLIAAMAIGFVGQYPRITKDAKEIYSDKLVNGDYGVAREYFSQACDLLYGFHVQYRQEILRDERSAGEILMSGAPEDYFENYKPSATPAGSSYKIGGEHVPIVTATPVPAQELPFADDETWETFAKGYKDWRSGMVEYWNRQYESYFAERLDTMKLNYCIWSGGESKWCGTNPPEDFGSETFPFVIRVRFFSDRAEVQYNSMYIHLDDIVKAKCAEFREVTNYIGVVDAGADLLKGTTLYLGAEEGIFEESYWAEDYAIYWYRNEIQHNAFSEMWENYVIFTIAALCLVGILAIVFSLIKPLRIRELWLSNLPLELLIALVMLVVLLLMDGMGQFILVTQMSVDFPHSWFSWGGVLEDVMTGAKEGQILLIINGIAWFGIFAAVYFGVVSVLQLFYKRPLRFLKENTIIGRIVCFFGRKGKQLINAVTKVDFNEKGNRKILIAVLINFGITYFLSFLILWLILQCNWHWYAEEVLLVGGFVVFLVLLGYHILLYLFLIKKWNMIRLQYTELLQTTEEMASGDTKVTYNGKPGIFRELQEKLARVQAGFDTAVQEEVKSQRMKSELITNVSHDLKTPLTAIITYVDLLKNENITAEERQEYVQVLEAKAARLKTLIEDLFEVSKANSGNIKLNPQELDLVQLIQEVQLNLEDRIMQSGIQFKLSAPEEKVLVCLDGQKTCRIFENLFVNITKYGLYGSRAFVDVERLSEKVRVTIKNVSATEITYASDEIMERFTRGDASRNTEGSGLGLAIVKSFVEAQGGTVEIQLDGDLFKVIVEFPCVIVSKQEPEVSEPVVAEVVADEVAEPEDIPETASEEKSEKVTETAEETENLDELKSEQESGTED